MRLDSLFISAVCLLHRLFRSLERIETVNCERRAGSDLFLRHRRGRTEVPQQNFVLGGVLVYTTNLSYLGSFKPYVAGRGGLFWPDKRVIEA